MNVNWTDIIGLVAGVCTTISVVPQIVKVVRTKKHADVSLGMFSILVLGVGLWLVYGIVENDLPIMITNGIALTLNSIMLYIMIKY